MAKLDESKFLRDAFPEAKRRELDRWWLSLQLEELSALGDQLRHWKREGRDGDLAAVLARLATVLEAVRWNRTAILDLLDNHVAGVSALPHPEDAFGLALVCDALGSQAALHELVDALDAPTLALLQATPGWPESANHRTGTGPT
jgi:hypothetical protein